MSWPAAALVAACALACACRGAGAQVASGENTPPPRDEVRVEIGNLRGAAPLAAVVRSTLIETSRRVRERLPAVAGVTMHVRHDPVRTIPRYGLGGYTTGPDTIDVVLDDTSAAVGDDFVRRLQIVTAHELHHTARWRRGARGTTLADALIFEGLASRFAEELVGGPLPRWLTAFPETDTDRILAQARAALEEPNDYGRWFLGRADIPAWTGYTLGYRLVVRYQQRQRGVTAADLVSTPARVILGF